VTHTSIQQESVHAIFPNDQHVMLWCQAGFRKCANLAPGTYQVEPDGDNAVRIYVYSIVSHKLMGKMKYRVIGSCRHLANGTIAEKGATTVHVSVEENHIPALGCEPQDQHVVVPKENRTHHRSAEHPTTS
jgi:hypothetical protein